ncbi:MAG: BLUF domain-containing protein [Gemmatimonadota bacterium]
MNDLIHLVYASEATSPPTEAELAVLLRQSRASNDRRDITGMLLYSNHSFFQILEGRAEVVEKLLEVIAADPRHRRTAVIIREPILSRTFGDWTMGFMALDPNEHADLVGGNDFFEAGSCFTALSRGRAKKLLAAFAEGRWRAKIVGPATAVHDAIAG